MGSAASTGTERLKQAALARRLEVSRQSINELVKRGVIPQDADGLIDVELARVAIANRVRPSSKTSQALGTTELPAALVVAGAPAPAPAAPPAAASSEEAPVTSFHVARTLKEAAEARMAQLKLAEMRGELVRADEVRASLARRMAALREGFLQLPSRVVPLLVAEPDAARMDAVLRGEIHAVLAQLTDLEA